jgi:hypothetical protein
MMITPRIRVNSIPAPTGRAQDLFTGDGDFTDYGRRTLTGDTSSTPAAELTAPDGQYLTLNDGDHIRFDVDLLAGQADGSTGYWSRRAAIKREGATTSLSGSVQTLGTDTADAGLGTPTIAVTADAGNNRAKVSVTPANATATSWKAVITAISLNY